MIVYLIKSLLCSAVLLTVYYVLLEKSKTYTFNRFYLLGSLMLSALLPLFSIHLPGESKLTNSLPETFQESVPIEQVLSFPQESTTDILMLIITFAYVLVLLLLLYRFIRNLIQAWRSVKTNNSIVMENVNLIVLPDPITPHTFLNHIFVSQADSKNQQILTHELTHARQLHSLDIIVTELIQCFLWFNPVLIFYKRSIRLNHEFLADEAVLQKCTDVPIYQQLLLDKLSGTNDTVLASSFNYSITKKRFNMMTSMTTMKQAIARIAFSLTLLMITSFAFIDKAYAQAPAIDEYTIYKNGKWQNEKLSNTAGLQSNEDFLKSIQREIRYPQSAKEAGIVGDVTVMFEVDTKGNPSNFTTIQTLHDKCEAEVIRSIKNSTAAWNIAEQDGRKYPSRYVLRVSFQLEDLKRTGEYDLSTVSAKALNPVIVTAYR